MSKEKKEKILSPSLPCHNMVERLNAITHSRTEGKYSDEIRAICQEAAIVIGAQRLQINLLKKKNDE